MKPCSYCGGDNPDDAVYCRSCGTDSFDSPDLTKTEGDGGVPPAVVETAPARPPPAPDELAATWRARDGWLCLLNALALLFCFTIILGAVLKVTRTPLYSLRGAGILPAFLLVLQFVPVIVCTLLFSRVTSINDFQAAFDIKKGPNSGTILVVVGAFVLAFLEGHVLYGGLDERQRLVAPNFLTLAALLSPFVEEPFFRGFTYRAFRNSYGVGPAMAIVVTASCLFHADRLFYSPLFLVGIGLTNLALCLVKERCGGLLDCIAFHFFFNVAILLQEQ